MLRVLRWLGLIALSVILMSSAFAFYTYFLVDYSLENLETALAATEPSDLYSPIIDSVYHSLMDDAALQEVTSEKLDLKNLVMSEATSRSFQESLDRNGHQRAKVYLNQLAKRKKADRNFFLTLLDNAEMQWMRFLKFINFFSKYFQKELAGKQTDAVSEAARFVLLSKAQNLEKSKQFAKLAELYRQYLRLYPESPDRGFVSIALASLLIQEGRVPEAEHLFKDIQFQYAGKIESRIASQGLKRIARVNQKTQSVDRLKIALASAAPGRESQVLRLRLAKAYISIYRFSEAEEVLKGLAAIPEGAIPYKARFYLAWIYKQGQQFALAKKIFLELLESKEVPHELEFGIRAELADIYYRLKDSAQALKQYAFLKEKASAEADADDEIWKGISAFEQANIYHYDLKDTVRAQEQLNAAGGIFSSDIPQSKEDFFKTEGGDLRTRAFRALGENQVGLAYELFSKYLVVNPKDSWSHAGLATVFLLLGDLKEAGKYVEQAYRLQSDEYTASMVGYVHGIHRDYTAGAEMYKKALERNPEYVPARFNLACMDIRLKRYDEALNALNIIEKNPAGIPPFLRAKVLNNIGYVFWKMGQREQALKKFEKAVKEEPAYTIAAKNIKILKEAAPKAAATAGDIVAKDKP